MQAETIALMQHTFKTYLEDIFGLRPMAAHNNNKLDGVLELLISIRADAKKKKDFATSDLIRNQLAATGIQLKDEKDGSVSYTID